MHCSIWIGNDNVRPTTLESKECSQALSFLSHCQETVKSQEEANSYLTNICCHDKERDVKAFNPYPANVENMVSP
jgi:hypothetical protein